MKEKLYTIPLNDAVNAGDECPFCYIERNVEQDLMDFVLGSCASYMESDVREDTDREGFCRTHMKKMFDYGNTLGNGGTTTDSGQSEPEVFIVHRSEDSVRLFSLRRLSDCQ